MIDYGEMRNVLRSLNEQARTLDGMACPNGYCFGTLHRRDGYLVCSGCSHSRVE